jgi:hypothetical protein
MTPAGAYTLSLAAVSPIGKEPRGPASTGTPQNEITDFFVIVLPPVRGGCRVLLTLLFSNRHSSKRRITDRKRVTPRGQPEPGFPAISCNCWLYFILHESIYYFLLQLFLLNWFDHQKKTSSYYLDMAILSVTD